MSLPTLDAATLAAQINAVLPAVEAVSAFLPVVGPEVVTAEKFLQDVAEDSNLLNLLVSTYNQYVAGKSV